jgi:DNA-binding XRE family transcriptional regulator
METRIAFTERLNRAMYVRGKHGKPMNNTELARMAEITTKTIALCRSGKRCPQGVTLAKIAKALGVSIDWLMGVSDKGGV